MNQERMNMLRIEPPQSGDEASFDINTELKTNDWESMSAKWRLYERSGAGSFGQLAAAMHVLAPEKEPKCTDAHWRFLRDSLRTTGQNGVWGEYFEKAQAIQILFPQKSIFRNSAEKKKLKSRLASEIVLANDADKFRQFDRIASLLVTGELLFGDNSFRPRELFTPLDDHLKGLRAIGSWDMFAKVAAHTRLLFPQQWEPPNKSTWAALTHVLEKDRAAGDWFHLAVHAARMKILAAREASIGADGLTLTMGKSLKAEVPPVPHGLDISHDV